MADGRVYTVVCWDVVTPCWRALFTFTDPDKAEAALGQLRRLAPMFFELISVDRDDDDLIEASVAMLQPVCAAASVQLASMYLARVVGDARAMRDAAVGLGISGDVHH